MQSFLFSLCPLFSCFFRWEHSWIPFLFTIWSAWYPLLQRSWLAYFASFSKRPIIRRIKPTSLVHRIFAVFAIREFDSSFLFSASLRRGRDTSLHMASVPRNFIASTISVNSYFDPLFIFSPVRDFLFSLLSPSFSPFRDWPQRLILGPSWMSI